MQKYHQGYNNHIAAAFSVLKRIKRWSIEYIP